MTDNPGSFGLTRIGGIAGLFVWLGQRLSGDGSKWTHVFFVLDNDQVIEGQPGGARLEPLGKYANQVNCDPLAGPEPELRERLVQTARALEGTPYNWLNYPALGLLALGIKWEWLRRFVRRPESGMICSQLVDYIYMVNGVHLFNDGREPMDVTPGDLARLFGRGEPRS
jgi:hypothetical protein